MGTLNKYGYISGLRISLMFLLKIIEQVHIRFKTTMKTVILYFQENYEVIYKENTNIHFLIFAEPSIFSHSLYHPIILHRQLPQFFIPNYLLNPMLVLTQ